MPRGLHGGDERFFSLTLILTVNALMAADTFLVPVAPSYLVLEGVVSLGETIRRVREGIGEVRSYYGGKVIRHGDSEGSDA